MRPRRLVLLLSALLALLTLAAFHGVLGNGFISYDDNDYVYRNRRVVGGLSVSGARWAMAAVTASNWHPLTWMSHMLDVEIYGLNPAGHHLTSLLLHVANVLLLFTALARMTGSPWRSAAVASLFAVHPLRVESVAWIAERKDVLCGFFWMLALHAYVGYARRPSWPRYLAVFASFAMALMAKPMAVTLPVVLLLLDHWPLDRVRAGASRVRLVVEKLPLLAASAAVSAIALFTQKRGGSLVPLHMDPPLERAATALVAVAVYLGKLVWPDPLAVLYPRIPGGPPPAQVAAAVLVLAALSSIAWRGRRLKPQLAVGWLWYLVTILPVAGFIQVGVQAMADRYTYLPLIGVLVAVVFSIPDRLTARAGARRAGAGSMALVLCALTALTVQEVTMWKDSVTLFRHAVRVTGANPWAHMVLGVGLSDAGRRSEAIAEYREALRLYPGLVRAHFNLALDLEAEGDREAALASYREALRFDPAMAPARVNEGLLLHNLGRNDEALASLAAAARGKPDLFEARHNFGFLLLEAGRAAEAEMELRAATRLDPGSPDAHHALGRALAALGRLSEARAEIAEAVRLDPARAAAHLDLARVLLALGDRGSAAAHAGRAAALGAELDEELAGLLAAGAAR